MFTRCNACHTVHPLNAALLAQGGGKYRCGKCNKLNNALQSLFDDWPDAGQLPSSEAGLPTLGMTLDFSSADSTGNATSDDSEREINASPRRKSSSARWISIAIVLVLATVVNLAWFFRGPLLESSIVQGSPLIRDRLVQLGLMEARPVTPMRDLEQLQLISSDLRSHPSVTGALRLNATIMNQAEGRQAYPDLEVLLLDSRGQAISRRTFEPSEYLAEDADIESGMTPRAYLPLVLDLSDPGQQAVGFEIRIR